MARVVLVVEDEALVRLVIVEALLAAGFLVIAAGSGREALGRAVAEPIDALVCDLALRGSLDGYDVGHALCGLRPGVEVILISGFCDPETAGFAPLPRGWRFMEKPFPPEVLCETLAAIFAERDGNARFPCPAVVSPQ